MITRVAVVLLLTALAAAQSSTGRIIGNVTDPQSAAVPSAKVTATNVGTNVSWNTRTNDVGAYQILDLPIGQYTVTVAVQGFIKAETHPQELNINQSLRIDLKLKLGAVSEKVEVNSEAAQVETVDPTLGGTVTGRPIQALPLNGRETLDLALTQPGVVPAPSTGYGSEKNGEFDQGFTVAGGRPDSVTYLLDGGLNNAVTDANVLFDPNPDAVAEFRILTNNYTAEYGRSGGGTVSVVTKSGTNSVHGSLFEYLRNDAMNASDFFSNEAGRPRPVLKRNQFGGTIGGPIEIPHVVNGKDKLFFFFAYEGQRQSSINNFGNVAVFNPATITGDFSQAGPNGTPDQNVANFLANNTQFIKPGTTASQAEINPAMIDHVAQNYINNKLIPVEPNGVLFSQAPARNNFDQYTGKVDWFATQNDHLSLTIGSENTQTLNGIDGTNTPGYPLGDHFTNQTGNFSYLKIISAALVNEAHLTASRFHHQSNTQSSTLPLAPTQPTGIGVNIGSDFPTGPSNLQFASGMTTGYNPNSPRTKEDDVYAATDTLTWIKAKHTFKFGGRLAFMRESSKYITDGNGLFDFGSFFDGSTQFNGVTGNGQADFLIGAPDLFLQFAQAQNNEHQKQWSAFAQDEWKVSRRLALTLGVRYEYTSPETDTKGYNYVVIPGLIDTRFQIGGTAVLPPGMVVPGDKGAPSGWYFPDYKDIAPRLGFAWDVLGDGATSVRGGVGMFYDTLNGWMSDWNAGGGPWFAGSALGFFPPTGGGTSQLADPYGQAVGGPVTDPYNPRSHPSIPGVTTLADQGQQFPYGSGVAYVDPNLKTPYIYQYNLSVQRQLGRGLMTEIGYVGSSSHKLLTFIDRNPIDAHSSTIDPLLGVRDRILTEQLGLHTFVNDYASMIQFAGKVNANYNGLLASLTKSAGPVAHLGDMFFTLSYTWSHNLDNGSGFNQRSGQVPFFNTHQFYSNSDFDVRHRLVFSGGWDLPFASMWETGPKWLTKGWSLYPIAFYQSGVPIDMYLHPSYLVPAAPSFFDAGSSGYGDSELERPDQLGPIQTFNPRHAQTFIGPDGQSHTGNYYFNPQNFAPIQCLSSPNGCPTGTYGSFQRNSFVGPDRVNFNLALEKSTNLGERMKMLFRVEAFNIFNHAQFVNPGNTTNFNFNTATLGQSTQTYDPRILQLSLRLAF